QPALRLYMRIFYEERISAGTLSQLKQHLRAVFLKVVSQRQCLPLLQPKMLHEPRGAHALL
ncbi:hypothetical protein, partial [Anaerobiospirillum succiniciproducens]|uniref:hypothetical protein n=1 Tax=Anaerobiospirillum succiniciproducens TaxID=13335 RepID=UPI001B7F965D